MSSGYKQGVFLPKYFLKVGAQVLYLIPFVFPGQLLSALESKVKHAQCFDVALMDDGSVVLASKDYRLYIYRYVQLPPMGMLN